MGNSMCLALFGIDTWFYKILYSIMQSILKLVDEVYKVVLTLCGMKTTANSGDGLLETLIKDSTVKMIFKWISILGVCVMCVVIAIAVIRAIVSRKLDDPIKAQKGIAVKTLQSILIMVLIPVFFFSFIGLVSDGTKYIINSMSVSEETGQVMETANDWSVAQEVFDTATSSSTHGDEVSYLISVDTFNDNYSCDPNDVNYIIGIIGGAIVLVAMFMMGLKLAERIFMLIFYYIISPLILAISPLDDGNRFSIWKDSVIAKLLASGGIIVCINLFLISMPVIKDFSEDFFGSNLTGQIFNLLFIIAGSFFASRGGEIIANLVGDNIGANEGRETADSLRKASAGAKIGIATVLGGASLGYATLIGTRSSRATGTSNTLEDQYNTFNTSNNNSDGKATKTSKLASIGSFGKEHYTNVRKYGIIGGTFQNIKSDITKLNKFKNPNNTTTDNSDGKAIKQ